jgi:hypothetical protein
MIGMFIRLDLEDGSEILDEFKADDIIFGAINNRINIKNTIQIAKELTNDNQNRYRIEVSENCCLAK